MAQNFDRSQNIKGMIEPPTNIINNFITYFVFRIAMKVWQKIHITLTLQGNNKTCFFSISFLQKFRKKKVSDFGREINEKLAKENSNIFEHGLTIKSGR